MIRTAELVSHGYFIHAQTASDKCPTGGKVPSLYRMTLTNGALAAEEIAYGVDDFQVQYGVDTNELPYALPTDNSVDSFVDAPAAGSDDQLGPGHRRPHLAAGARRVPGNRLYQHDALRPWRVYHRFNPNDHYRRQLYTSTIRLRNR